MSWKTIIGMCVTPFIPIDILKIAISLVVAYKLAPAIQLEEVKQKKEEHA
jgi:biotin transporter BioY